jgi:type II secretory pathway component PulF
MSDTTGDIIILNVEDGATKKVEKTFMEKANEFLEPSRSLKLRQKVVFFRMLATMVNASLTVLRSLQGLRKQEKNKNLQRFYDYMIGVVQSGTPLHVALKEYF